MVEECERERYTYKQTVALVPRDEKIIVHIAKTERGIGNLPHVRQIEGVTGSSLLQFQGTQVRAVLDDRSSLLSLVEIRLRCVARTERLARRADDCSAITDTSGEFRSFVCETSPQFPLFDFRPIDIPLGCVAIFCPG